MSKAEIVVRLDDLQRMFDALCSSMDFGSGFLELDDVISLRRVARILGVSPDDATPGSHIEHFPHKYKEFTSRYGKKQCTRCNHPEDWKTHREEGQNA